VNERPPKLPPSALLVVWGCDALTLGEAVVWYHDWCLDQGGRDGSYISHESLAKRLGGKLKASTISTIRQRLKRITLHEPIERRDARNVGWISTLPRGFLPHTYREAPAVAVALAGHLRSLKAWAEGGGQNPAEIEPTVQAGQSPESISATAGAAALGGRGVPSALNSVLQAQLPSAFREKGVGSDEPNVKEERTETEVRAEGMALIRLQEGKMLTQEERRLVEAWLRRHSERAKSVGLEIGRAAS